MGRSPDPHPPLAVAETCVIAYKCIDCIDLDRLSGAFFWHQPGSDSSVSITEILYIVESYPIVKFF